jgi:Ca-activated chloride channel homolog
MSWRALVAWWQSNLVQFASPWAFAVLLLVPLIWWWQRARRASAVPFPGMDILRAARPPAARWRRWTLVLRTLVLVLLTAAAAMPYGPGAARRSWTSGIDLMLAMDISSSMLAEDFQPQNRLEVARAQLAEFVRRRTEDRVGLVAFSGEALTQVPLTTDHAVVLGAVARLQPGQLEDGTAIGTAIATAANRLRAATGGAKVMVLLTDGVNNRGQVDPRTAARAARAFGIRIYAIGVGTEGMAPVPVGRGLFGLRYEMRPVEIDDALLTEVAEATGGRYFRARDADALERITREIDRLERAPVASKRTPPQTQWFLAPIAIALGAFLLEQWLRFARAPLPR